MEIKPSVLIVDDDENTLGLMQSVLTNAGFETDIADGGRAAIKKIDGRRPDLVTLDLVMPDVDGWGVLAHLRRVPSPPPVLVVTGHPDSVGPFSVMASVAAYIVKPFSTAELVTTCSKVVTARVPKPPGLDDRRREIRRNFVVQAQVLSSSGQSLGMGHVVELSPRGLRLDADLPLTTGQEVEIVFRLPGQKEPMRVKSVVRWRQEPATGLEVLELDPAKAQQLQDMIRPLGSPPR